MSPGKAAGRERRSAAIRDALHAFSLEQVRVRVRVRVRARVQGEGESGGEGAGAGEGDAPHAFSLEQAADPTVNQLLTYPTPLPLPLPPNPTLAPSSP